MGQRHQLFVIAKINGQYRRLAALHHQWLFGFSAVKSCLRLLKTFQLPGNRPALEAELRAATALSEEEWNQEIGHEDMSMFAPFPFITTCLDLGASFDLECRYASTTHLLPFNEDLDNLGNNDGITILDITNPSSVKYCFAFVETMFGSCDVEIFSPLDAREYFATYEELASSGDQSRYATVFKEFESWGVITVVSLREAWPKQPWHCSECICEGSAQGMLVYYDRPFKINMCFVSRLRIRVAVKLIRIIDATHPTSTLKEIAMEKLLDKVLAQSSTDTSWIEGAELLSDFIPYLKTRLYTKPYSLKNSPLRVELLRKVIQETEVDLSPFSFLSASDILAILSGTSETLESLNLSGNKTLNGDQLKQIVSGSKNLSTLYLLDGPRLGIGTEYQIFANSKLENLLTSEGLLRGVVRPAMGYAQRGTENAKEENLFSQFPRLPVAQMFEVTYDRGTAAPDPTRGTLEWSKVFYSDASKEGRSHMIECSIHPLHNAFLTPKKLITVLRHYFATNSKYCDLGVMAKLCAIAQPVTCRSMNEEFSAGYRVGAKPAALASVPCFDRAPMLSRKIVKNEWTIIFIREFSGGWRGSGKGLANARYAFVTRIGDTDASRMGEPGVEEDSSLLIADMETFLRCIMTEEAELSTVEGLMKHWNSYLNDAAMVKDTGADQPVRIAIESCGREEAIEVLKLIKTYDEYLLKGRYS
jgi:hypothetical protein